MLNQYRVNYHKKNYTVSANSASEAIDKIAYRSLFGKWLIGPWHLDLVDADTNGKEWACGHSGWYGEYRKIYAEML